MMESVFARNPVESELHDPNRAWAYNVIPEFKSLTKEEIKQRVIERRLPYALCIQNTQQDFNIATSIRNANAFGAEIYYYGNKKFDKRGMCGVQNYTPINHIKTIDELKLLKSFYNFVGMEIVPEAVELAEFKWPKRPLIIVGQENCGIIPEILELCEFKIKCSMLGSVPSINMGCASAIALYSYMSQYKELIT